MGQEERGQGRQAQRVQEGRPWVQGAWQVQVQVEVMAEEVWGVLGGRGVQGGGAGCAGVREMRLGC